MPANHHSHTHFSDGKGSPEDYLEEALKQGLEVYGFSDHAPIRSEFVGAMTEERLKEYVQKIETLKKEYADKIQIYKALEVDFIPGLIDIQTDYIQEANLDYTIGAIHYVDAFPNGRPWGFQSSYAEFEYGLTEIFEGDIKRCVHRHYELMREMILNACPDIVAHMDRLKKLNRGNRYFNESESWYQAEISYTLDLMAKTDAILEINTKGHYTHEIDTTYPGEWTLGLAYEMGIPVHLSSDAHRPENITRSFDFAAKMLEKIGFKTCRIFYNGQWEDMPLKKKLIIC